MRCVGGFAFAVVRSPLFSTYAMERIKRGRKHEVLFRRFSLWTKNWGVEIIRKELFWAYWPRNKIFDAAISCGTSRLPYGKSDGVGFFFFFT